MTAFTAAAVLIAVSQLPGAPGVTAEGGIEEIGEDHLHVSKGDALATPIPEIDKAICATCTKRVFLECSALPKPEGLKT